MVPTRLEGMETRLIVAKRNGLSSFRPDLRGWKLSVLGLPHAGDRVPTRLEGMETWGQHLCHARSKVPTRLEGMETRILFISSHLPSSFRPDLRGWKPKTTTNVCVRKTGFRPDLRGWKLEFLRLFPPIGSVPTRLEGMETIQMSMATSRIRFRPDLRGWKPIWATTMGTM